MRGIRLRNWFFIPSAFIADVILLWLVVHYEWVPGSREGFSFIATMIFSCIVLFSILCLVIMGILRLFSKKAHIVIRQFAYLGPAMILIWILVGRYFPHHLPTGSDLLGFDSVSWRNDGSKPLPEDLVTVRQKMLKDVVCAVLPGKSKQEIENILGPSTRTDHFKGQYDLIYVLGPERDSYFGLDYEWLLIRLEDGKFSSFEIVND
ncbi:MAG: hypothetical protein HQL30_07760 [Candidatus Omnitrophica bacterium]|nr:hypothetical protein [Candidatus Omnitrophota bacterium]